MTEYESIIRGLVDVRNLLVAMEAASVGRTPLIENIETVNSAIAALTPKVPRVLEYAELEATMADCPVWYEAFLTESPCLAMVCSKSAVECAYWIYDFNSDTRHRCTEKTYGDVWRCWDTKPTEEQRKAVKW